MCLLKVYNRIGGGGCKFVSRQLLDGLEYLISAIPKRDKEESPDEVNIPLKTYS